MEHTKGEWKYEKVEGESGEFRIIVQDIGKIYNIICEVGYRKETKANARLIAAALELLGACKEALGFIKQVQKNVPHYGVILESYLKQAITKAERGEASG